MITLKATLQKFDKKGEKTGWTYIDIEAAVAERLNPGVKKSFFVKGSIDQCPLKMVSLIPMGQGDFILPVNGAMRKALGKKVGDWVKVNIEQDHDEYQISEELLYCIADDPEAKAHFESLPKSHRNYYSKWVDSAKTESTRADRITKVLFAMQHKLEYGEMIRHFRNK